MLGLLEGVESEHGSRVNEDRDDCRRLRVRRPRLDCRERQSDSVPISIDILRVLLLPRSRDWLLTLDVPVREGLCAGGKSADRSLGIGCGCGSGGLEWKEDMTMVNVARCEHTSYRSYRWSYSK